MRVPTRVRAHLPELDDAQGRLQATARNLLRTIDLLQHRPRKQSTFAVVEVDATFLFRDSRIEDLEVPASFGIGAAPPTPETFVDAPIAHTWIRSKQPTTHSCTSCSFSPGHQPCTCSVSPSGTDRRCPLCDGLGEITCLTCNGERACSLAQVAFAEDYTQRFRRVYFPMQAPWSAACSQLRAVIEALPAPEELAFPLEQRSASGPYRGGPTKERSFHGFRFGDGLERARADILLRTRRGPTLSDVRVFAWPVLELLYRVWGKSYRVLLTTHPDHGPRVFVDA